MASFEIYGGKPLKGELTPQGAKKRGITGFVCPIING
jgi:hypothetical protein